MYEYLPLFSDELTKEALNFLGLARGGLKLLRKSTSSAKSINLLSKARRLDEGISRGLERASRWAHSPSYLERNIALFSKKNVARSASLRQIGRRQATSKKPLSRLPAFLNPAHWAGEIAGNLRMLHHSDVGIRSAFKADWGRLAHKVSKTKIPKPTDNAFQRGWTKVFGRTQKQMINGTEFRAFEKLKSPFGKGMSAGQRAKAVYHHAWAPGRIMFDTAVLGGAAWGVPGVLGGSPSTGGAAAAWTIGPSASMAGMLGSVGLQAAKGVKRSKRRQPISKPNYTQSTANFSI